MFNNGKSLIVFYNSKQEILLQDRRTMSKFGEEWGFFGGSIEEGESPEQALIRETMEELTYDLTEYDFLGAFTHEVKGEVQERFVFIAPMEDTAQFIQKEGDGMRFFSLDEAEDLNMMGQSKGATARKVLEALRAYFERSGGE